MTATRNITFPRVGVYQIDVIEVDGLKWLHESQYSDDRLTVHHEMEPAGESIHDYICSQFKPGDVFLDIGAHEGHYALRAAKAGCEVYAVEANPETVAWLRMNRDFNGLACQIWGIAAWDRHELLEFSTNTNAPFRTGSATLMEPEVWDYHPAGITVAALPLDVLLADVQRLDLVKMDVEGSDVHVMDGMIASLIRLRPRLVLEDHQMYETYTAAAMQERLERLHTEAGYEFCDARELGVKSPGLYIVGLPSDREQS